MKRVILLAVLLSTLGVGIGLTRHWVSTATVLRSGQVTFSSEQDYTAFKMAVIQVGADWNQMDVMSSAPPILVKFAVNVAPNAYFPYGTESAGNQGLLLLCGIAYMILAIVVWGIVTEALFGLKRLFFPRTKE